MQQELGTKGVPLADLSSLPPPVHKPQPFPDTGGKEKASRCVGADAAEGLASAKTPPNSPAAHFPEPLNWAPGRVSGMGLVSMFQGLATSVDVVSRAVPMPRAPYDLLVSCPKGLSTCCHPRSSPLPAPVWSKDCFHLALDPKSYR